MNSATPLLQLDSVSMKFGGLTAVDSLSFSIYEGENRRPHRAQRRG
jgi:ABC-type branched-subunit amino acid transport system ATPase component